MKCTREDADGIRDKIANKNKKPETPRIESLDLLVGGLWAATVAVMKLLHKFCISEIKGTTKHHTLPSLALYLSIPQSLS